jgi:hypothetical protein
LAQELKKDLDKLKDKVDKVDAKVDSIGAKVDGLIPRIEKIEVFLSNDGPDADGDGVPDIIAIWK